MSRELLITASVAVSAPTGFGVFIGRAPDAASTAPPLVYIQNTETLLRSSFNSQRKSRTPMQPEGPEHALLVLLART